MENETNRSVSEKTPHDFDSASSPDLSDSDSSTPPNMLPCFMLSEQASRRNLLPNNLPRMSSRTGTFPEPIAVHPDAKYANGLMYKHSHEHVPEALFTMGLTEDIWFCYHNIEASKMIPGIPDPYFDDCARGQAIYVTGLSANLTPGELKLLFDACGKVKYTVALIDMNSGETFRWVVMGSFQDAWKALKDRKDWQLGSRTVNVCYALPPGSAVALLGRSINEILFAQQRELIHENDGFKGAVLECYRNKPAGFCDAFNDMVSARVARTGSDGHTARSPFVGYVPGDATPEVWKTKIFNVSVWSPSFMQFIFDSQAAEKAATAHSQAHAAPNGKSPMMVSSTIAEEARPSDFSQSPASSSGSDTSTVVPPTARKVVAKPAVVATPVITPTKAAPVASSARVAPPPVAPDTPAVPVAPVSAPAPFSWASIAAPAANGSSNLVFNLHLENKSNSAAPRVAAPVNPNVIAHQEGESLEEQMRIVIILNLPKSITLQNVSDAISEGSVLTIQFATDEDNGQRYVGIVFQYAEHAKAFRESLIEEKKDQQPSRFKFIVDVGTQDESMLYPYDELLEDMEPPMNGTRRLTIVKKAFFFVLSKKDLRNICTKIAGPDKIQLIWFYNGGNASVVFADVKSAVAVKTKFDEMSVNKTKFGSNLASFEGLTTSFSKDPCYTPMNLYTDIPDHNKDD